MTSVPPSDSESNASGFIRYSDKNFNHLYSSMIEKLELMNQDILQIERNFKNIVEQAGPLKSQLSGLFRSLPVHALELQNMETD